MPECPRIAIYAQSFDPPTRSQREDVVKLLQAGFTEVVVCPLGPKLVSGEHQHASPLHRAALVTLGFRGLHGVTVDYDDLSENRYSSPHELEAKHNSRGEVWHVIDDARNRPSTNSRCIVFHSADQSPRDHELRSDDILLERPCHQSSDQVRQSVYSANSVSELVVPLVESYLTRHQLFVPYSSQRRADFKSSAARIKIVVDPRNQKSVAIAEKYSQFESAEPEFVLVLGGDGTMLHAIKEHWRLRIPFVGVNTGHLGFLMNERLPMDLNELELISYTLPMLRVDAESLTGEHSWGLAFSDVWVERAEGQAAWIRLDVDGETRVEKIVGDGMLVSTASGSSAYARAMGAVPVPLNTPTLTLAGSNIFQPRFWKPMMLPDDSTVTLASLDRTGKRPVRSYIDGTSMGIVQQLTIKRSLTASVEMAFTREFDPSARLLRSLFPPDDV